jgi:hemolysin III
MTTGKATAARRNPSPLPFQTPGEEIANSVLHGFGALLAMAGLIILVLRGSGLIGGHGGSARHLVAYAIYGASMIILFLSSTLYHALVREDAKRVFRVLDHGAIYLLIAGTYTPFCLIPLHGAWGWTLFGIEWGLAITGIVLYALGVEALRKIEVAVYILMGWAVVFGWAPLTRTIPRASAYWMIAGGLMYTLGTIWYGKKARRGTHVTWHVFVLAGAVAHWWAIFALS